MAKNNNFVLFLLIFLIIVAFGLTAFLYNIFKSEGGQCLAHPLNYAKMKIEEANEGKEVNIICECRDGNKLNLTNMFFPNLEYDYD